MYNIKNQLGDKSDMKWMSTHKPTNTAERKVFLQVPLLIYQTVALSEYMGSFRRGTTQPAFVAQSCPGGTETCNFITASWRNFLRPNRLSRKTKPSAAEFNVLIKMLKRLYSRMAAAVISLSSWTVEICGRLLQWRSPRPPPQESLLNGGVGWIWGLGRGLSGLYLSGM